MGGHGGLNILPQKSWNVYNRDNREKVRKDQEQCQKEEERKRKRVDEIEQEKRYNVLKQKSKKQRLEDSEEVELNEDEEATKTESQPLEQNKEQTSHINFFSQYGGSTYNAEYVAEKKTEEDKKLKKLGLYNPTMGELKKDRPWYSLSTSASEFTFSQNEPISNTNINNITDPTSVTINTTTTTTKTVIIEEKDNKKKNIDDPLNIMNSYVKKSKDRKKQREEKKQKEEKEREKKKNLEKLREERVERERKEREKAAQLLGKKTTDSKEENLEKKREI